MKAQEQSRVASLTITPPTHIFLYQPGIELASLLLLFQLPNLYAMDAHFVFYIFILSGSFSRYFHQPNLFVLFSFSQLNEALNVVSPKGYMGLTPAKNMP